MTDAQLGSEMSEEQARNLLAEAGKLAKPGMLGFGGRKYDEAADVCKKAANIYKMLKKGARLPHPYLPYCAMHKHTAQLWRRLRPRSLAQCAVTDSMQVPRRATRS